MDLIADIGATHSRCALLDDRGRIVATEVFNNPEYSGIEAVLEGYLHNRRASNHPRRTALAIAAPVMRDRVEMINIDWKFSQAELRERMNLTGLLVVNDAAAIAWGVPDLNSAELRKFGGGDTVIHSPVAVIGPGSGLGVAALIPARDDWTAVTGEGGHVSISPITEKETAVADYVRARAGHCSAENLLSGPGLVNIFNALEQFAGRTTSSMSPAEISAAADAGDPLAVETHHIFFCLLGTVAGNLALTVGARGGVFVAGGIVPKLIATFAKSDFRARFEDKGAYRFYLEPIPTYVILEPYPAFRGLRKLLGYA